MFQDTQAVIFDLDGTLVDSMWVWKKIDDDFIKDNQLNISSEELMEDVAHFSFTEVAEHFKRKYGLTQSVAEIKAGWQQAAEREYSSNVYLKAGAKHFLERLKEKGIRLAVATSNSRHLLTICLVANGILDYFDALVTTDETQAKSKSEPDVYLLAADKLGVAPENCVVFEDIPHAMRGAKRAGMRVVAVSDAHTATIPEELEEICELLIEDFTALAQEHQAGLKRKIK